MLGYFRKVLTNTKDRLNQNVSTLSERIKQLAYLLTTVVTLFWLSVFFYGTFYYYYVPIVLQEKPVYFQFRVCENGIGMCTFPMANVSLIKEGRDEVFKRGQPYKIILDMNIPESPANKGLGMFMTEIRMYNRKGETVQTSSRSGNLHYRSELLLVLETLVFSPFLVFGYMQQKQALSVELFPHYLDDTYNQAFGAVLEVQSLKVEIYSAILRIFAQFYGVRYFLYYWPLTSAIIGISINFFLLSLVAMLSWIQFFYTKSAEPKIEVVKISSGKSPRKRRTGFESRPHPTETVGPSHSDEDSAPDQDDTELLQPTPTSSEDFGLRLRQTTRETE